MKSNITVNEALQFFGRAPDEVKKGAVEIVKAYLSVYKLDEAKTKEERNLMVDGFAFAIYNAGRIDGIRSERAHRKQKAAPLRPDPFEEVAREQLCAKAVLEQMAEPAAEDKEGAA